MPLDFEIYGGQDEKSIEGNTGIFIKKIKEGSSLQRTVHIGDHILKVSGERKIMNTKRHFQAPLFLFLYITLSSSMTLKISWLRFSTFFFNINNLFNCATP